MNALQSMKVTPISTITLGAKVQDTGVHVHEIDDDDHRKGLFDAKFKHSGTHSACAESITHT